MRIYGYRIQWKSYACDRERENVLWRIFGIEFCAIRTTFSNKTENLVLCWNIHWKSCFNVFVLLTGFVIGLGLANWSVSTGILSRKFLTNLRIKRTAIVNEREKYAGCRIELRARPMQSPSVWLTVHVCVCVITRSNVFDNKCMEQSEVGRQVCCSFSLCRRNMFWAGGDRFISRYECDEKHALTENIEF